MLNIAGIQNEKLRTFLQTYRHFTSLKEEEQQKYLEKLIAMPVEEQQKIYDFLFQENEKEKVRMLKALNEKLSELSRTLKKIKTKEQENIAKESDNNALAELENQLKQNLNV